MLCQYNVKKTIKSSQLAVEYEYSVQDMHLMMKQLMT